MTKLCIRELRQRKGLSQTDLAKAMNVSAAAVGKWESGEYQPSTDKLPKLAMLLGVDIGALFAADIPGKTASNQ